MQTEPAIDQSKPYIFPRQWEFWALHILCWASVVVAITFSVPESDLVGRFEHYFSDLLRFLLTSPALLMFRYSFILGNWQRLNLFEMFCLILGFNLLVAIVVAALVPYEVPSSNALFEALQRESVGTSRDIDEKLVSFVLSFCLQSFWCFAYVLIKHYHLTQGLAENTATLSRELDSARSIALTKELSPHFLFNGLNNLCSLIDEDSARAQVVLRKFAELLRFNINAQGLDRVRLVDELRFVTNFISLCELQYESRLRVKTSLDRSVDDALIPPMTVQILVENAIKYGFGQAATVNNILLATINRGSYLEIVVENKGDLKADQVTGTGIGLRNLQARLDILFAGNSQVDVQQRDEFVVARVVVPKMLSKNTSRVGEKRL